MGLLNSIAELTKAIFGAVKQAKNNQKKYEKYKSMTNEELLNLSDSELFEAVNAVCYLGIDEEKIDRINTCQRVFFTVSNLDAEVNNGGLCQFFVNSSRACAPYVSQSLEDIGALKTKKLFDDFVKENNIDVNNLDSFIINNVSEFEEQNNRYPFDDFDTAYYEIEEINKLLVSYARINIRELIEK